jgi:hypothetical protein
MKMKQAILLALLTGMIQMATAQCDSTAYHARKFLGNDFISDGQTYRALIFDDQVAEFNTTLYGGNTYKIAAMAGFKDSQLIYSLYDQDNNLLYTNEDHRNGPNWNFMVDQTLTVKIEAKLDLTKQTSGCAVILIGFKR